MIWFKLSKMDALLCPAVLLIISPTIDNQKSVLLKNQESESGDPDQQQRQRRSCGVYTPAKDSEIRKELLKTASYDVISRPAAQTAIDISLSILAIDELDIKGQRLTSTGWLTFGWTDDRLTWNSTVKDDISSILVAPATVWKPELVIDNSLANVGVISDNNLQLRISSDGTVHWEPLVLFTTHCSVDITFYPYDQQKCGIQLVSWGYQIDEIKLTSTLDKINLEDYVVNGEWIISKTEVEQLNLTEHTAHGTTTYPQLVFWFYLDRRTDFYNLNVMMPVFLTSILIMFVFMVPTEGGEKISYVLTVQLSLAVLLTVVNNSLPSTSITTSILGIYLGIVLIFAGVGILLTVLIIMLYHKTGEPDMESCLVGVAHFASKVTCLKIGSVVSERKVVPVDAGEEITVENTLVMTWKDVSNAINRLCLFIFMAVTIIMNIAFSLILCFGSQKW